MHPQNIEWLANLGIKWTSMYGNCHIPYIDDQLFADRIHVYEGGGMAGNGTVLVKALLQAATKNQTTFWYNSPAIALIKDQYNEKVVGVVVDKKGTPTKVKAKKGVVLATASIDHNPALAFKLNRQHYDDLMHKTCLSAQTNTGDGIIMGMSVGGAIGGLKINTDSQVLDNFDQPITGLYAAGLNAGGWLGPYYPGSGTAVSGIIHQGRKAAMHLAKI
ncbi:flavoprotein [Ligilactobacillus pobuzihii E100301 = KCTC 13174]|nr:flavoprotein [Ligilactobacillus pobuzihii E100301 = KCTC 13174]